ncbi:MAG: hypothetical protein H6863_03650 [Rhodospirillales bacterium]|nr:hypothetical protein [Rhodospirillales bacterium]
MQKLKSFVLPVIFLSELSHIFCCGIPLIFSLFSLLAGLGAMSAMPVALGALHETLHPYEIPIIIFSGVMLFTGWTLHIISEWIDCHNTGCGHEPCTPKKKRSARILMIATILFALNISGYFVFHTNTDTVSDSHQAAHDAHHAHSS